MTTQNTIATVSFGHITVRGALISQNGSNATVVSPNGLPFTGTRIDMEYMTAA